MVMTLFEKLKNFPRVYWLSLPCSLDRYDFIVNQFNHFNIKHKLVEPFNGKITDYTNHPLVQVETNMYVNSRTVAVSMSHLKMIKEWLDNSLDDEDYGFMAEDDLLIESINYWDFTWEEMLNSLPTDWEIIQLNIVKENMTTKHMKFSVRFEDNWGGCAYIIKRSYAKYLIEKYIENDIYVFSGKDFYVSLPENILYGIVRQDAYTLPLFCESLSFTRTLWEGFSEKSQNINVHSSKVCIYWWKTHTIKQLDLLF